MNVDESGRSVSSFFNLTPGLLIYSSSAMNLLFLFSFTLTLGIDLAPPLIPNPKYVCR